MWGGIGIHRPDSWLAEQRQLDLGSDSWQLVGRVAAAASLGGKLAWEPWKRNSGRETA